MPSNYYPTPPPLQTEEYVEMHVANPIPAGTLVLVRVGGESGLNTPNTGLYPAMSALTLDVFSAAINASVTAGD